MNKAFQFLQEIFNWIRKYKEQNIFAYSLPCSLIARIEDFKIEIAYRPNRLYDQQLRIFESASFPGVYVC